MTLLLNRRAAAPSARRRASEFRPMVEMLDRRELLTKNVTFPVPFPSYLAWNTWSLGTQHGDPTAIRKEFLLREAYSQYEFLGLGTTISAAITEPVKDGFVLKPGEKPPYFSNVYTNNPQTKVTDVPGFYDYKSVRAGGYRDEAWVDFSNVSLGGGVFGRGFAQEEVMFLETPELAYAAGSGQIQTRISNGSTQKDQIEAPLGGSPAPAFLRDVKRTIQIDDPSHIDLKTISLEDLDNKTQNITTPAGAPTFQQFNVLAIAAPRLSSKDVRLQTSIDVVSDLFNSSVAAFLLARGQLGVPFGNNPLIHTGRLGAGVFNNDPIVSFVMQDLAARLVSVDLQFWNLPDSARNLEAKYVSPVLDDFYSRWKPGVASTQSISALMESASYVLYRLLSNKAPGAPEATPEVSGSSTEEVFLHRDGRGREYGRPVAAFRFEFSEPMDAGTLRRAGNYRVAALTTTTIAGRARTSLRALRVLRVTPQADGTSVLVTVNAGRSAFPEGGQVTLVGVGRGALRSIGGATLGKSPTYRIATWAGTLSPIEQG